MVYKTLINGKVNNKLLVIDRGFQYGDGLFETIAIYKSRPLCWEEHIERLIYGCKCLKIKTPNKKTLKQELIFLSKGFKRAIIKIIVTRGINERGYGFSKNIFSNRVLIIYPWLEYSRVKHGVNLGLCSMRLSHNKVLAGVKSLNRLEQVMARSEWNDSSIHEGLVMDTSDNIIEGTMSNLFYIKNNILFTPKLNLCGIKGVIRRKIIENSKISGFEIKIKKTSLKQLLNADEIFVCNSVIGIWPVKKILKQKFSIGKFTKKIKKILIDSNIILPSC